jgi:hypothetical protein
LKSTGEFLQRHLVSAVTFGLYKRALSYSGEDLQDGGMVAGIGGWELQADFHAPAAMSFTLHF